MVVTGAPRKRLVRKGTWVRIPPSPPPFAKRSLRSRLRVASRVTGSLRSRLRLTDRVAIGVRRVHAFLVLTFSLSAYSACGFLGSRRNSLTDGRRQSCSHECVSPCSKRIVYILRSVNHPERKYIGSTADLPARLSAHNAGLNRSTIQWRPWAIDVIIEFQSERLAIRFEKFLKSGSGHAFAKRHFEEDR